MAKNLFHIEDVVQIQENYQKFLLNDFRANVIILCRQLFPQLPHDLLVKLCPKKPMVKFDWFYRKCKVYRLTCILKAANEVLTNNSEELSIEVSTHASVSLLRLAVEVRTFHSDFLKNLQC